MMKRAILILAAGLLTAGQTIAQTGSEALQRWKDRKYAMFIHFGVYSQLGGVWEGKPVSRGLSEQIRAHAAGLYNDEYERVAAGFSPEKWNPDSIALLAKNAGMGSVVITSKHHDGFALFDCAYTSFDIMDATPYKRDILKELSDACRRHGVAFGLYFSLIDWHFPPAVPISGHNSDSIPPEHHEYNKKQITELLTKYGPVTELWFDMGSMTAAQSRDMRELVHRLQPDCMIGSRIGNNMGDFTVMGDNQEPDYIIGVPWQSPASFFHETWGYRSWQQRGDMQAKIREKLTSLIRVTSRGGNFLLNIGPRGDGSVVEFERDVLLAIGDWLKKNGEAVYGTSSDPFHIPFSWGSITSRKSKLYLHLLQVPDGGRIELPGLAGKISKAYVLDDKTPVKATVDKNGVSLQLPSGLPAFKVIVLDMPGGYTVPPVNIVAANTVLQNSNAFRYFSNSTVDYNTSFTSTIKNAWTIQPARTAPLTPTLQYTAEEKGKSIDLQLGSQTRTVRLENDAPRQLSVNGIEYGPLYLQGPFPSNISSAHGKLQAVDVTRPWPNEKGKAWRQEQDFRNGSVYWQPADITTASFALQEITTPERRELLVKVTGGDAVKVWLNGKELTVQSNPLKAESITHVLLLQLEEGKNQLVVKSFNNFRKRVPLGIDYNIPQVVYQKELPAVPARQGTYWPVSWQRHHPATPHDDMGLPNLQLQVR